ncbi:MAG: 1-acyl-sn-glycerol-3-phosphate acyltransferase [Prevotellaceae bacterium]|jgi:putative hemolysin|nr:1-acyl-sn-glycerol-3-phosphate acyltransferase [Prevotellaceae bacterium]
METKDLIIDVDSVIKSKNPRLYKFLSGFVLRYIKRIIHQDELNYILTTFGHTNGLEFLDLTLDYLQVSYNMIGEENLPPENGRYIFVSNHPLGGLDGIVMLQAIGRKYSGTKFIVNDVLMYLKPLNTVFVPVNKFGRQSVDYANRIDNLYASDDQVLYFPAGLCSRKRKGKIIDLEWKKSFLIKAIKYKRDVVPIYFEGRNSNFFYNLSNFRTWLGVKANIELFYLSDELFKQKGTKFTMKIGKPIAYTAFDKSWNYEEWTNYIRSKVYELAE